MRLKKETLRIRCKKQSLPTVKFLDLSNLELVELEKLEPCESLHWLIASKNKLQGDEGLENLKQLWYLDLSNNQIGGLHALSRYLALGTVILTNNNLKWMDLEHIRHAHFLSISLHGNPCLDKDPYYRIHVIDCLPLIWELDGRLVTVTERLHVKQFFIDTELTAHPVRHKTGRIFRTSAIRNIGTEGVVSKQCKYIYSKFPMSETHTKHTDERRLRYLCHMVQDDILRWFEETRKKRVKGLTDTFLEELLEQRKKDTERCNMVLLLLVISLEFQLPSALMKAVLGTVGLDLIGTVGTMPFFLLPRIHRTKVICILLNAAKVDRDNNVKSDDGLYPQLFMCLYFNVARLTHISQTSEENMDRIKTLPSNSDYMALMASEVVSLMLQVPRFFDSLLMDEGIIHLVHTAVGDRDVVEQAQDKLIENKHTYNGPPLHIIHKIVADIVLTAITKRLDTLAPKMTHIPIGDRYLALSDSLPIKPVHSVIWASQFLTKGETIPNLEPPILNPVREAAKPKPIPPKMGDKVLLGPQVVGELASLLEGDIAMVKIDAIPISNGAVESKLKSSDGHFAYVDLKALCYARDIGMWRPAKTVGDKYTIHSTDTSQMIGLPSAKPAAEPLMFTGQEEPEKPSLRAMPSSFGLTTMMVHRSQSVGTGYLTGYRHSFEDQEYDIFANYNQSGSKQDYDAPLSARFNKNQHASTKMVQQKKRILSAPPATSVKTIAGAGPQQKAIDMGSLHLHDNVHHIRGLTPRADSERSGALTTPSTLTASQREAPVLEDEEDEKLQDIDIVSAFQGPETSRTNTPAPVAEDQNIQPPREEPVQPDSSGLHGNTQGSAGSYGEHNSSGLETSPSSIDAEHNSSGQRQQLTGIESNQQKTEAFEQGASAEASKEILVESESINASTGENGSQSQQTFPCPDNLDKEGRVKDVDHTLQPKNNAWEEAERTESVPKSAQEKTGRFTENREITGSNTPAADSVTDRSETVPASTEHGATAEGGGDGTRTETKEENDLRANPVVTGQGPETQPTRLEEENSNRQVGDNCPVCLATAGEATFITIVKEQGEGLVTEGQHPQQQKFSHAPEIDDQTGQAPRTDGGFTDENMVPPVGNYGDVRPGETARPPTTRISHREPSAAPTRASRFSFQTQNPPVGARNTRRPQSAIDPSRYYVIEHPPAVVATGRAANMFSHNGGHFKTDFQHQREEAWKRTTKHGRQRPLTAIVQRSTQQPLFSNLEPRLRNPGIRITRTDYWLAGGRDLYWEGIRKRPKSGHTPGWLEGLPDSMKRQRPRSALATTLHQPRARLSQRPQSSSALIVSSCYRCGDSSRSAAGRHGVGGDVRYMLTYSQPQPQPQQQPATPQLQISLQQQQQHEQQLLLDPDLLGEGDENPPPLSSPVSDVEGQEWTFPV